jgi:DNA-binding response OmpR family regulator
MSKTVLIADDDADIVELLTRRCQFLGFTVDSAYNAFTALGKIAENRPDVVILDVNMPHGNGLTVCEMMAGHEELQSIPVIVLTGSTREDTVRRCHQLCAYYVLKCTDVWPRIEPILRELFPCNEFLPNRSSQQSEVDGHADVDRGPTERWDDVFNVIEVDDGDSLVDDEQKDAQQRSDQPWVLSIEDDDDFALTLRLRIQEVGVQVVRAAAGMEGYRRAFLDAPQAIILDYALPQGNGDYILRRLKETPATREIPVIVVTGHHDATIERQMRALGANEYLTKPLDWKQLRSALENHLDKIPKLREGEKPEESLA